MSTGGRSGFGLGDEGRGDFEAERLNVGPTKKALVLTTSGPVKGKDLRGFQRPLLCLSFRLAGQDRTLRFPCWDTAVTVRP